MAVDGLESQSFGSQDENRALRDIRKLLAAGATKSDLETKVARQSRAGEKYRAKLPKVKTGCFTCRFVCCFFHLRDFSQAYQNPSSEV
jgi:hypothetical protein